MIAVTQKQFSALFLTNLLITGVVYSKNMKLIRKLKADKTVLSRSSDVFETPVISGCAMICSGKAECISAVYDEKEHRCYIFPSLIPQCTSPESSFTLLQSSDPIYKDCQDAFNQGERKSGEAYSIQPEGSCLIVKAICEFDDKSGWTVIQIRFNGHVDFYRPWADYVKGFGEAPGEYWLGLEAIYHLTKINQIVGFDLETHSGKIALAYYTQFYIDAAQTNYTLHVSGYKGYANDSMITQYNGQMFSTFDRDNDKDSHRNCAQMSQGAWWYGTCNRASLNKESGVVDGNTILSVETIWQSFTGDNLSLKNVTIKITSE